MANLCQKVDGDQLGDTALSQVRPDRFELCAVWQIFANFNGRIRLGCGLFRDQFSIRKCHDRLPLHNTTFFQPLGSVFPDDVLFLGDESLNCNEKFAIDGDSSGLLNKTRPP
jgi:hypothetical protein